MSKKKLPDKVYLFRDDGDLLMMVETLDEIDEPVTVVGVYERTGQGRVEVQRAFKEEK